MSMKSDYGFEDNIRPRYWHLRLVAFGILLLYFFIATFPNFFNIIATGLDPSWVIGINYAANHGLVFGKDIVFTYGPLGYLLEPLNFGKNLIYGAVFQIFVHLLWILLFVYMAYYFNFGLKVFAFVFLVLIAIFLNPSIETQLLFLIPCYLTISLNSKRWLLIGVPITILAALCLLIKFSLGPVLLFSIMVYSFLWLIEYKTNWKVPIITILVYTISVLTFWLVLYGNLYTLYSFLRYSWEIASGFSKAMGLSSIKEVIHFPLLIRIWDLPLALTCAMLLFILLLSTKTKTLLNTLLIFVFPFFISFKHGFVRADFSHIPLFFSFLILTTGLILLYVSTKKEKNISVILVFISVFSTGIAFGQSYGRSSAYSPIDNLYKGYNSVSNLFHWSSTLQKLNNESNENLESSKLPQTILKQIKDYPVDIIPWEISYILANHLNWDPSPVFQAYSAYTSKLDNLNAQHLISVDSPKYVIYQFESIDNRHPFFDEPKTFLELYKWYNAKEIKNLLLLRRRVTPRYIKTLLLSKEKGVFNKKIIVPDVNALVIMKVRVKSDIFWKLVNFLYRLPTFTLMVEFENGKSYKWRLVPGTMKDGIIINVLPTSLHEVYLLFEGDKYISKVRYIKFLIANHNFMTPTLTIDWLAIPVSLEEIKE